MKRTLLTLAALVALSGAAFAQKEAPKKAEALPAKAVCPIMKDEFKPTAKSLKSDYKGKTYYFCCPGCKPAFDKEPEKYAGKAEPKKPDVKKPGKKSGR